MTARLETGWIWGAGLCFLAALVGLVAGVNPKLSIVLALGLVFVLIIVADLAVGLALFTLAAFFELVPVGGAALSLTKVAGLLLALSWFALVTTREDEHRTFIDAHPLMTFVLVAFLGWNTLSLLWAENGGETLSALYRFAQVALLFFIVFTAVQSRRHAGWIVAAFVAGSAASAVYGILSPPDPELAGRLTTSVLDPNELASLLVSGMALAIAVAGGRGWSTEARLAATVAAPLCGFALLLTLSRGGLVALGVALLAAVLFGGRWRMRALVVGLTVAACVVFYFNSIAPSSARERITEATTGEAREQEGRATIWEVGWRIVEDKPIEGVGSGNFSTASIHYLLEPGQAPRSDLIATSQPSVAHNTYLQVLAELGVVGFGLFALIVGFSLSCALRAAWWFQRKEDESMELLARGVLVAAVGLLAADFFLSEQFGKQLWLLMGLGPALLAIARGPGPAGHET